jgi:hypothetical protein
MSDPEAQKDSSNSASAQDSQPVEEQQVRGPSLPLFYSLIALALVAAIGFALMIVLPFYHRR